MDALRNELSNYIPWLLAAHLIAVIAWMAGMLYLPRLFVYHCETPPGSEGSERFKVMERRLLKGIINPSMTAVWILGLTLAWLTGAYLDTWMQVKFVLVIIMSGMHGLFVRCWRAFAEDRNTHSARFYRIINEVPALLMVLIVRLEPRPANPRACFARGVNLNGPALVVAGHAFQSAAEAAVVTSGTGVAQAGTPYPAATGALASLLQTTTRLQSGDELSLPVDNGSYLAYLYATSPSNDAVASVFTLQGAAPELGSKFRSQAAGSGQAWARLGPFRVDVTNAKLTLGVTSGSVSVSGIELWYPD